DASLLLETHSCAEELGTEHDPHLVARVQELRQWRVFCGDVVPALEIADTDRVRIRLGRGPCLVHDRPPPAGLGELLVVRIGMAISADLAVIRRRRPNL